MAGITAAIIGGVATVGSGIVGYLGAQKASKAQSQAANQQVEVSREQMQMLRDMFERQLALQEPFRQAGITAQNRLLTLLGLPGGNREAADFYSMARPFSQAQFRTDPGYAFRMSEGMKALERSAAARGGLLSGATMKGIQRFGQNLASEEYANAFNRYQIERTARLNPLQAMLGLGQTAANQMSASIGSAAQNMAGAYGQLGQAYGNLGQARASGYVGGANAAMGALGGLGNIANQYAQNQMLTDLLARNNFAQTGSPYAYGTAGYTGFGPFLPGIG